MALGTAVNAHHPSIKNLKRVEYVLAADTELVAAVTGKQIHVYGWIAYAVGGTTALESATSVILGPFAVTAAPMVLKVDGTLYASTTAGQALNLELSATDSNAGTLWYSIDE